MTTLLLGLVLLVVLVIAGVAGGAALLARSSKRSAATQNQVVPGVATNAPAEWFGAHTPEAKLHRRLRDAVATLAGGPVSQDPSLATVRSEIEAEALAIDERLVAVSRLPAGPKSERLDDLTTAVEAVESLAVDTVDVATAGSAGRLDEIQTRLRLLGEARTELADLDGSSESMRTMRELLDREPPASNPGESGVT